MHMGIKYADFFGGVDKMQEDLTQAVRNAKSKLTPDQWRAKIQNLTTNVESVLANPRLMTSSIFSELSFALDLNVDDVLRHDFTAEEIAKVVEDMRAQGGGLVDAVR